MPNTEFQPCRRFVQIIQSDVKLKAVEKHPKIFRIQRKVRIRS